MSFVFFFQEIHILLVLIAETLLINKHIKGKISPKTVILPLLCVQANTTLTNNHDECLPHVALDALPHSASDVIIKIEMVVSFNQSICLIVAQT